MRLFFIISFFLFFLNGLSQDTNYSKPPNNWMMNLRLNPLGGWTHSSKKLKKNIVFSNNFDNIGASLSYKRFSLFINKSGFTYKSTIDVNSSLLSKGDTASFSFLNAGLIFNAFKTSRLDISPFASFGFSKHKLLNAGRVKNKTFHKKSLFNIGLYFDYRVFPSNCNMNTGDITNFMRIYLTSYNSYYFNPFVDLLNLNHDVIGNIFGLRASLIISRLGFNN